MQDRAVPGVQTEAAHQDATVIKSEPVGWFEDVAINGVKRWRYRAPGREVIAEIVVEFKLPPEEDPESVVGGQ